MSLKDSPRCPASCGQGLAEWPVQLSLGIGGGIEVLAQDLPRSGMSLVTECALACEGGV